MLCFRIIQSDSVANLPADVSLPATGTNLLLSKKHRVPVPYCVPQTVFRGRATKAINSPHKKNGSRGTLKNKTLMNRPLNHKMHTENEANSVEVSRVFLRVSTCF